jgi:tetratricopeptide (TPR) repeat protein
MAPEPSLPSSPPAQRLFATLSCLGIFLLLLLAGQGCGKGRVETAFERGKNALKSQNYELAITNYTEAIRLKPDFAEAYYNRGVSYDNICEWDKAIADFSEVIRLKPDYEEAYMERGQIYATSRLLKKATWACLWCGDCGVRVHARRTERAA